jgi:regulator of protease activity HflC (stomatin/prohibitin superfamily)
MLLDGFTLLALVLAALAVATVAMGVRTVPQGREFTVERFGRFTRWVLPPSATADAGQWRSRAAGPGGPIEAAVAVAA